MLRDDELASLPTLLRDSLMKCCGKDKHSHKHTKFFFKLSENKLIIYNKVGNDDIYFTLCIVNNCVDNKEMIGPIYNLIIIILNDTRDKEMWVSL